MRARISFTMTAITAAFLGLASAAIADGVLVVGITSDPGKDGFVYGFRLDQKNPAEARELATKDCRNAKIDNTEKARKNCKVVGEFRNKCFAFAFDPKVGTPGVGWAIASSKASAEKEAMDKCVGVSTSERASFCAVEKSGCDGDAN